MFRDGDTLDRYFETAAGVLWLSARVSVSDSVLLLTDVLLYPTTSSLLKVGVADVLQIVSTIEQEALLQGLASYVVQAERVYTSKPARMIYLSRKLR